MPDWMVFGRKKPRRSDEPRIGIQKTGRISLNAAAYAALGKSPAVELLHDRAAGLIGLRAVGADSPTGLVVRPYASGTAAWVSAAAFLAHAGSGPAETTRRYRAAMLDDVLTIDLARAAP